jgi:hypothetical protein
MVPLVALTLFVSASLLFVIEPMAGKLVLPLLGGTPAVWNTCVMFFQFELLAGYLYAHVSTSRLGQRAQFALHLALLGLGLLALSVALRGSTAEASNAPILTVIVLLARSIGLPLLAVAATAPLLQRWLATTRDPAGRDPFFLYAASNLGSLIALLAYPFAIEPLLRLRTQRIVWSAGYLVLIALTAACAWQTSRSSQPAVVEPALDPPPRKRKARSAAITEQRPITNVQRVRWLALAFVPSLLMLAVTTYISTDVAAVPLLWVLPLALYLLTYVMAFARRQIVPIRWLNRLLPLAVVAATYFLFAVTASVRIFLAVHLTVLFIAALFCHTQLAAERPPADHLTEYYLWISVGGFLGGVFTTLVAPALFTRTVEYPLGLILAVLLRPRPSTDRSRWGLAGDVALPSCWGPRRSLFRP